MGRVLPFRRRDPVYLVPTLEFAEKLERVRDTHLTCATAMGAVTFFAGGAIVALVVTALVAGWHSLGPLAVFYSAASACSAGDQWRRARVAHERANDDLRELLERSVA